MKKNYFFKTILLATIMLMTSVSTWAQTKVFFEFKGTSGYLVPPATGWTSTGAEGGSYLKLSPGSIVSPEYSKATGVVFKYDIASFGSGTTSQTKLYVLALNGDVIQEHTLTTATSSTYTANQTVNIGDVTSSFKIKIEGVGTGVSNSGLRGTRLRNYSLEGKESSTAPSPTINVDKSSLTFDNIDVNEVSQPQVVAVTASNLSAPLSYTVTGTNDTDFEVSGTLNNAGGSLNVSFAPASAGSKTAVLTITDGTINKTVNLSGTAVAPALISPIANLNPIKGTDGFTALWNPVVGATEYILNVYTKSPIAARAAQVVLSENFDGFSLGATGAGAHASDISASLDTYTQETGWIGSKIYQAGGTAKMGASGVLGYITTPEIDLSANGGAFTLSFDAMAWSGDATSFKVYLNDVEVYTVSALNNDANYTLKSYSIPLTGGTAASKIKFEGLQASKARFFLENLEITQDGTGTTINHIAGSPFTGLSSTSYTVSGLAPNTTYYYTVVAKNTTLTSAPSNEVAVDFSLTSINETEQASNINAWVSGGEIHFNASAGELIELFSITGQKLDNRIAIEGINDLKVSAKGVIILKVGNKLAKVIL